MKIQFQAVGSIAWMALGCWRMCLAQGGEQMETSNESRAGAPQEFVVCTGWHALCAVTDCRLSGDGADCDCFRVEEPHIVETSAIQDMAVKRLTQARCTTEDRCDVDEAPVCGAIKNGAYEVNQVRYDWVSTYSYRGWCSFLRVKLKACDQNEPGYAGDLSWALCDAAPCTETQDPEDAERPLSCQCQVRNSPFVGANGSCTGDNGGIMSSFPLEAWDFERATYTISIPGYEYVHGACAALKSDPVAPR